MKPCLFLAMFITLCLLLPCSADAENEANIDCDNARTTHEMRYCAGQNVTAADKILNETYRRVIASLTDPLQEKLRIAQRAWLAFRDASAAQVGDSFRDGTFEPLLITQETASLTEKRTTELTTLDKGKSFAIAAICDSLKNIACLKKQHQKADRELNRLYKKAMAELPDAVARGKLQAAQKAWIGWRDADTDFMADWSAGRSKSSVPRPNLALAYQLRRTEERNKDLRGIISTSEADK